MSRKGIWALSAMIMLMVAILFLNQTDQQSSTDDRIGSLLLPSLQAQLSDVNKMVFGSRDSNATLVKNDATWQVEEKYQLTVAQSRLSKFLRALAEAKIVERKTSREKNFSILGVGDNAIRVDVFAGNHVATILVGKTAAQRDGQYVRLEGDGIDLNQVWLIDTTFDIGAEPQSWLNDKVIDIEAETVQTVSFIQGDKTLEIVRVDGQLEVVELKPDLELNYPTIVNTLGRGLVNVRFEDVVPVIEIDFDGANHVVYELKDASRLELQVIEVTGKYWLNFVKHETSDWAYEVDRYTFESLTKSLDDITQPKTQDS